MNVSGKTEKEQKERGLLWDIYEVARQRVICGGNTAEEALMSELANQSAMEFVYFVRLVFDDEEDALPADELANWIQGAMMVHARGGVDVTVWAEEVA